MNKQQLLFLLNALVSMLENDRLTAQELAGKTPDEMLEIAKAKESELFNNLDRVGKLGHED